MTIKIKNAFYRIGGNSINREGYKEAGFVRGKILIFILIAILIGTQLMPPRGYSHFTE